MATWRRPAAATRWAYAYETPPGTNKPAVMTGAALVVADDTAIGGTQAANDSTIGAVTAYDYDNAGDLLTEIADARENTDPDPGGPGGTTSFTYDSAKKQQVATMTRQREDGVPASVLRFYYTDDPRTTTLGATSCTSEDVGPGVPENKEGVTGTVVDGERPDPSAAADGVKDYTWYCVDKFSRVKRVLDANRKNRATDYNINSNVEVASMEGTQGGTASYEYTYEGEEDSSSQTPENPMEVESPTGSRSSAAYDEDGKNDRSPTSVSNDTAGQTSGERDKSWEYRYDEDNNLTEAKALSGSDLIRYRYCWTREGQIYRIDPVTAEGNVLNSTEPDENTDQSNDNRCDATGGQGNDTLFTYFSGSKELKKVNKPDGGDQEFTYDQLSRIKTVTDGRQNPVTTTFTYDAQDRTVKTVYTQAGQPSHTVEWVYDRAGNLTDLDDEDSNDAVNDFTYDELNRKTMDRGQGPGGDVDYTYDEVGNVETVQTSGESEPISYIYDDLNRVKEMDDQRLGEDLYVIEYDNQDHRDRVEFPNVNNDPAGSLVQIRVHNDDGNLECVYSYRSANPPANAGKNTCIPANSAKAITFERYDYSKPGTQETTSTKYRMVELGGKETAYEYDGIKRLTNATTTLDDQANTQVRRFQYTYDRHSNLTSEQATGTTPGVENGTLWSAFSPGDQICASIRAATDPGLSCTTGTTGETTFTHDGAGNMTEATGGPTGSLGGLDLAYNLPGQTGSITAPGATNGEAQEYDGVMQDRRTTSGETTMSYGYAGLNKQTTTGLSPSTEIFVRDPAGKLMAMITNTAADEARYYLTDDQKTVIATTDQDTDNVIRYLYEPYGQTVRTYEDPDAGDADNDGIIDDGAETLTGFPTPTGDRNPFGYISGYTEPDTGFIKFGTRYYIPELATWTQRDPEKGKLGRPLTLNSYGYSGGDPVNQSDPSGRFFGQDVLDATGEFIGDTLTEIDVYGGVIATAGASAALIGIGIATCVGVVTCAVGGYLIGVGVTGLATSAYFGYEASKDAYDR